MKYQLWKIFWLTILLITLGTTSSVFAKSNKVLITINKVSVENVMPDYDYLEIRCWIGQPSQKNMSSSPTTIIAIKDKPPFVKNNIQIETMIDGAIGASSKCKYRCFMLVKHKKGSNSLNVTNSFKRVGDVQSCMPSATNCIAEGYIDVTIK